MSSNEYYRRRNDSRRSTESEHEASNAAKKATVAGYNESYKKNTAGYKNDSGYATFDDDKLLLVSSSLSLLSSLIFSSPGRLRIYIVLKAPTHVARHL